MKVVYFPFLKKVLTEVNFNALFSLFMDFFYVCLNYHFPYQPIRMSGGYNCFSYNHFCCFIVDKSTVFLVNLS